MTSNITKKVIEDLIASDKKGLEEYGVTVDRKDYTLRDWLQEAYEETCDTAKYLKAAIEKMDNKVELNKAMEALKCVVEDIEMLQDGTWSEITDEDCEATLDNLVIIMNYLESQMKK
jgi:hypothetical protein